MTKSLLEVANEFLEARVHPNHAVKLGIAYQAEEVERTLVIVVDETEWRGVRSTTKRIRASNNSGLPRGTYL